MEHGGSQELLMEGVRLTDEMEESLRSLPPGDTILQPAEGESDAGGDLKKVIQAYAGGATIQVALERSGIPPFRFYPFTREALNGKLLVGQTDTAVKTDLLRKIKTEIEKL